MHDIFGGDPENEPLNIASNRNGFQKIQAASTSGSSATTPKRHYNILTTDDDQTQNEDMPVIKINKKQNTTPEPEWFKKS